MSEISPINVSNSTVLSDLDICEQLADFISAELGVADGAASISPGEDLIKRGLVDSMGVLQILAFIEQTYGISISDQEISVKNFRSIDSIARLVAQRSQPVKAA